MKNIEIPLPQYADYDTVAQAVDGTLTSNGLTIMLRDSLKKYPGCIHWHAKNGRAAGTLEVTLWPEQRRAWFTVQEGRKAVWIEEKLDSVASELQRRLQSAESQVGENKL